MTATQDQTAEVAGERPEHRFTFGLWTVGNPGRDPVRRPDARAGGPGRLGAQAGRARRVGRQPARRRPDPVGRRRPLNATGSWPASRRRSRTPGMGVGMATTNLFGHAAFKDGAFTSNDRGVRRAAIGKAMNFIDIARRAGRRGLRLLGRARGHRGRRGQGPARRAGALPRGDQRALGLRGRRRATTCASRWSPSPTSRAGTSSCRPSATRCTSSRRSTAPRWSASTPRSRTRRWPGCRSTTRSARRCGRASSSTSTSTRQRIGRYDQDFRFGAEDLKETFLLVRLLERAGYAGPLHFDAHSYRNENAEGVWDFAAGCMAHLPRAGRQGRATSTRCPRSRRRSRPPRRPSWRLRASTAIRAETLKAEAWELDALAERGYFNERLDQILVDVLLGVR